MEGTGAPESSLMKKFMPLRYACIVEVLILRTEWAYVTKLVNVMRSRDGNGRVCVAWKVLKQRHPE